MSESFGLNEKFSAKKLIKYVKAVKPILKILKKHRTNVVTPSTCNFDIVESFQNDINETELYNLDFKFFDDADSNEANENLRNEELEKRLMEEKISEKPFTKQKCDCEVYWAPRADFDIYERGDEYVTCQQTAEQQVSLAVV